jgi:hypothetical protein
LATGQRGNKKSLIGNYAVFWQQAKTYCQNMATSSFFFAPHKCGDNRSFCFPEKAFELGARALLLWQNL